MTTTHKKKELLLLDCLLHCLRHFIASGKPISYDEDRMAGSIGRVLGKWRRK